MDIEPFIPYFSRPPNKVIKEFTEEFDDGCGHRATIYKVIYIDSKKKVEKEAVRCVVWE